jgi:hypothetical protein
MSPNEYGVSTRRWSLRFFSALLALALFGFSAAAAQELKQIKLTERQIQNFIAAHEGLRMVLASFRIAG